MKVLILTSSCKRDRENGRQAVARETWAGKWGQYVDHKFVLGCGNVHPATDELIVDAPDSYMELPFKNREAIRWALNQQCDYVFQSCIDTYIAVPRLLGYNTYGLDYIGHHVDGWYASGGCGYLLSRKACGVIAKAGPYSEYEDKWAGKILSAGGIGFWHDDKFFNNHAKVDWGRGVVSVHLSQGTNVYDPRWMCEYHNSYLEAAK